MSVSKEQILKYLHAQGVSNPEQDGTLDKFMNGGSRQAMFDEAVKYDYALPAVERWLHLTEVMGVPLSFKSSRIFDETLDNYDGVDIMDLKGPADRADPVKKNTFRGSFEEVKQRAQSEVIGKEGFETGELADIQAPDLNLSDAFQLYAQLRGETDGARTLFLMDRDEMWDLSRTEDSRLTEYEFREIVTPYLSDTPLDRFIEQEVPFRLENVLGINVSKEACHNITEAVKNHSDIMFDYERFDEFLADQTQKYLEAPELPAPLPKMFIFDDDLMIHADLQSLDGYLWAVDALVDRLPMPEDMENINFYAEYDVKLNVLSLTATYDTPTADGEVYKTYEVSLSEPEQKELLDAMEAYCQKQYDQSLLEFVNDARAEYDLPAITPPAEKEGKKSPLQDRIQAAESRTAPTNTFHNRASGSHGR